jgi:hypothetical protein
MPPVIHDGVIARKHELSSEMKLFVWAICLILAGSMSAQSKSPSDTEKAAIQFAKKTPVSSLDRDLPKVSLEFFLQYESGGAPIKWEVNDCGEQTGKPDNAETDSPICVEAGVDVKNGSLTVMVAVGTYKNGLTGAPTFFFGSITDVHGNVRPLRRLRELPVELHRRLPSSPKELPPSVGSPT